MGSEINKFKFWSGFDNTISHQEILDEDFEVRNIEYKENEETISEMETKEDYIIKNKISWENILIKSVSVKKIGVIIIIISILLCFCPCWAIIKNCVGIVINLIKKTILVIRCIARCCKRCKAITTINEVENSQNIHQDNIMLTNIEVSPDQSRTSNRIPQTSLINYLRE